MSDQLAGTIGILVYCAVLFSFILLEKKPKHRCRWKDLEVPWPTIRPLEWCPECGRVVAK